MSEVLYQEGSGFF